MAGWKQELAEIYKTIAPEAEVKKILEIGTGWATNLSILIETIPREFTIYSIDPDEAAIETAKRVFASHVETGRLILQKAYAEQLPFEDSFFGMVVTATTLHHLSDIEKAIHEVHRVLADNGFFIAMDWTPDSRYNPHPTSQMKESMHKVFNMVPQLFAVEDARIYRDYYIIVAKKTE
ncbi:MAG: hypothetical protein DRJ35_03380 [Thermoprotei archaeon]|nr:MAG: hypothetical protein DRJ35_03380 [Thermoprotei archaeon]